MDPNAEERALLSLLARKDWPDRVNLVKVLSMIGISSQLVENPRVLSAFMSDPDLKVRRDAAIRFFDVAMPPEVKWIEAAAKSLDDPDIFVRRTAVVYLAQILSVKVTLTPDETQLLDTPNWSPAAPVPGEERELEAVRAAAIKFPEPAALPQGRRE